MREEDSEPEPAPAVVSGSPRDDRGRHPTSAVLAVAVADTTLAFDRGRKGPLRARAGIPESWVAHLLVVCRAPGPVGYWWVTRAGPGATVAPLCRPEAELRVKDLLP